MKKLIVYGMMLGLCLSAKAQVKVYFVNKAGGQLRNVEVRAQGLVQGISDDESAVYLADTTVLQEAQFYRLGVEFFFRRIPSEPARPILFMQAEPPMEHVLVTATRIGSGAIANTVVGRSEIAEQNTGRDLPVLLQLQSLEAQARMLPMVLIVPAHNGGTRNFNVMFNRAGGKALEARPLLFASPYIDGDYFAITLRLIQV